MAQKSHKKPNSAQNSTHPVEKTSQIVEKSQKTSGKLVQNSPKNVEKPATHSGKPVQKPHQTVHNSSKTAQNSVDKSVQNSSKSVNKATASSKSPEVEQNRTCKANTSSPRSVAIKVDNLHKSFRLPTERANGLKQAIFNWFKGVKGYTEHQVLRGVSFEVKKGEFVGIVGRNGSGKSTLLKLLAGIYYPEQGTISVDGTLVPFIELGVGFNPELTGRENVYLNGALLGFSRKEMDAMYDEIVHFAELEPFMDAKLKNYSSGMQVRLAFSIAIRAKGDILILDEVLAVGDAEFQQKCNDYFASLHGEQTVILVTHSMENVRRFCDRAILIENGEVATEGNPEDVAKAYEGLWQ